MSGAQLARTLLRDAQDELAANWHPFVALDLSLAMLEAHKAGLDDVDPTGCFLSGLDALRTAGDLRPWLYRGAAQIGWTATALHRALGLRLRHLDNIDDLIISWVDDYPRDEDTELLFGIVGLGVYGLDHVSRVIAQRIAARALDVIDERLERGEEGSYVRLLAARWDQPGISRRRGWRAVGVAHGNAGIVAFLASVVRSGLGLEDRAQLMLCDVARWLVSVATPDSPYVFDSYVEPGKAASGTRKGRSSWCHGDPGIALALAGAADVLDDPRLREEVRAYSEVAAGAVIDRPAAMAGVVDCCVCHGAAFLYYFGRRLAEVGHPGAPSFAERWYAYIRDTRAGGRLSYGTSGDRKADASFLGGDSGVVCALTRYMHGQAASWERLLLMR